MRDGNRKSPFGKATVVACVLVLTGVTLWAPEARGQVQVSMTDVFAAVNDEVWVDVVLAGVNPATPITSFQMTVRPSDAWIEIATVNIQNAFHQTTGTLTATGWTVGSLSTTGKIGGYTGGGGGIVASGTLVRFKLRFTGAGNGTVSLVDFRLNTGVPAHAPAVPLLDVTVTAAGNRAPVAVNDNFASTEGGLLSVDAVSGVLSNDTDADGQPLTASLLSAPSNGSLILNVDGSFTYQHDGGETTGDSFTYQVSDGSLFDDGLVSITVTPVNDPPTALAVSTSARASVPKAITLGASDPDDTVFSFAVVEAPSHGSVSITGDTATYTATAGYVGPDSFTYRANDGEADSPAATVSINVTANTAPTGVADTYSVEEGGALIVAAGTGVLANDSDADGDALSVTLKTTAQHGTLALTSAGGFNYLHDGSETLTDAFTYTLSDGSASVDVVVTINVVPINDVPVAVDGTASTQRNTPVSIPLQASDPDNPVLTYSVLLPPTSGDVVIVGSTATYTPYPSFSGTDDFLFVASDGMATSNAASVTVTVMGVAHVQWVQNISDPLLDPADIYVDGVLVWNDARFRKATGFSEFASGRRLVAIAPGNSTSVSQAVDATEVDIANDGTYTVVASGTVATDVQVSVLDGARTTGTSGTTVDVRVLNGASNVASLDVRWMSDTNDHSFLFPVATGLPYGSFTGYVGMVPRGYNLEARPAGGSAIDTYRFDWSGGGGTAMVLMSSGLAGTAGTYGFSLMSVDAAGVVTLPTVVTSTSGSDLVPRTFQLRGNFPNPFNPTTMVQFDLPEAAEVSVRLTDLLGREALTTPPELVDAGMNRGIPIDAQALSSGIYIYRVTARAGKTLYTAAGTMTLLK